MLRRSILGILVLALVPALMPAADAADDRSEIRSVGVKYFDRAINGDARGICRLATERGRERIVRDLSVYKSVSPQPTNCRAAFRALFRLDPTSDTEFRRYRAKIKRAHVSVDGRRGVLRFNRQRAEMRKSGGTWRFDRFFV